MPADIRLVRYTGEYGPFLEGFLTNANPPPLGHNFHIPTKGPMADALTWGFVARPAYRVLQLPITLVNIGDQPMEVGNVFTNPDSYQIILDGPKWMVIIKNIFSYSFDAGPVIPMKAVLLWDAVSALPNIPKVPSSFLNVKLSPGWGAPVADYAYAPIDITDVPDGDKLFTIQVNPPGSSPHVLDFTFNLNKHDLRLVA